MRILFIHQNFPGQFKYLAPALAAKGHEVIAMTMKKGREVSWKGIRIIPYTAIRGSTPRIHPWIGDFESKIIRGEACFRAALSLRDKEGYYPDIVIAHPGWGESLFLKEVWPQCKIGIYCEFYYSPQGADMGFDPEFQQGPDPENSCRLRIKNLNYRLHFEHADTAIAPTRWQADTFPEPFRSQITVIHDGIHTGVAVPNPKVTIKLSTTTGNTVRLNRNNEIITFVNRNLEPYRGYHIFMRALPGLLCQRPNARILIVGGNDVSYGARPKDGGSWKEIFIQEVRSQINDSDWQRVHFLGHLPYSDFIKLLQISTVHVYLTYPFVLSWSLLEAMSCGCAIVASDTAPVQEVIIHDHNGRLVNFFDHASIVDEICFLAENPQTRSRLGSEARASVIQNYDLQTVSLPRQLNWIESLV